jgi:hypothetical protein
MPKTKKSNQSKQKKQPYASKRKKKTIKHQKSKQVNNTNVDSHVEHIDTSNFIYLRCIWMLIIDYCDTTTYLSLANTCKRMQRWLHCPSNYYEKNIIATKKRTVKPDCKFSIHSLFKDYYYNLQFCDDSPIIDNERYLKNFMYTETISFSRSRLDTTTRFLSSLWNIRHLYFENIIIPKSLIKRFFQYLPNRHMLETLSIANTNFCNKSLRCFRSLDLKHNQCALRKNMFYFNSFDINERNSWIDDVRNDKFVCRIKRLKLTGNFTNHGLEHFIGAQILSLDISYSAISAVGVSYFKDTLVELRVSDINCVPPDLVNVNVTITK